MILVTLNPNKTPRHTSIIQRIHAILGKVFAPVGDGVEAWDMRVRCPVGLPQLRGDEGAHARFAVPVERMRGFLDESW